VFVSFCFCFYCFFCLFRYTLWVIILEFHSNVPLQLSVPPISSMCSAIYRLLLGLFMRPHCNELSMPLFDFGFRRAHDRLFFSTVVIRLVCFFIVYFPVIRLPFPFGIIFVLFLFPYSRFLFLLVIMLSPLSLNLHA
jgi:hypothetical protein